MNVTGSYLPPNALNAQRAQRTLVDPGGSLAGQDLIMVTAATWKHFDFYDEPDEADTDGIAFSATSKLPLTLLVWQQDRMEESGGNPGEEDIAGGGGSAENGIWEYSPGEEEGQRWRRLYALDDELMNKLILVRYGKRFGGTRFLVPVAKAAQILFHSRFRVDHGSDYAGEIPALLTSMVSGYVPSEGDIVYLSDQSEEGIYIALEGDWVQIGQPAPRDVELSAPDGIGFFDSDLYAVLTAETAEAECAWVRCQGAISPCQLATEPP